MLGMVLVCGLACALAGDENNANLGASDQAGAGAEEEAPVIRYHSVGGQQRIDLDDDRADDETYRAFQLARLTGEANMIVKQHEDEFREELRRRNEEREEREEQNEAQERDRELGQGQPQGNNLLQLAEGAEDEKNAYERIMGKPEEQPELGESKDQKHDKIVGVDGEPFDAVHAKNANDLEDHDFHFVMTDDLRHKELRDAVQDLGESKEESSANKLAKKMVLMQKRIRDFDVRAETKTRSEKKTLETEEHVAKLMKEHNEQFDAKGRVVPDF